MAPAPRILALLVLLLDLAAASGLGLLLDTGPGAGDLLSAALVLALFRHGDVRRWRAPSLLVAGALLSSVLSWALAVMLAAAGLSCAWTSSPWPWLLAPWPGHVAAFVYTSCHARLPVTLVGHGRGRRLALHALASTPCCRYRFSDVQGALALTVPTAAFGDRSVVLQTPRGPLPLHPEGPEEGMGLAVRRTVDVLLGGLLLLLAAPLVLLLGLLVRLTGGGPAFHSQIRLTRGERSFRIHKIRSMIRDAEPDGRAVWPEEDDPRITSLGRQLRRFWIDELPQLWDVLRGPMTLVGPRPERPAFVKEFAERLPNYRLRHQVRSGMTGLSQVLGFTGNTSLERRLHLDLRYIVTWTPWLDVKLMAATLLRVFSRLQPTRKKR